jgi:hypothetical protein
MKKGGAEMLTKPDQEAELLFSMVMKLAGSDDYFSEGTKATIWAECRRNAKLRNLALLYLSGNSNRAEINLHRLHTAIVEEFFTDPRTGEVRI